MGEVRNGDQKVRKYLFSEIFYGLRIVHLKLVVSDLRASLGAEKIEKILFLRFNRHLFPGLGKVVRELESLKEERDGAADAAFIAKITADVASIAL